MKRKLNLIMTLALTLTTWSLRAGVNPQITEAHMNIVGFSDVPDGKEASPGAFIALGSRKEIKCWVDVAGRASLSWASTKIEVYNTASGGSPLSPGYQFDATPTPRSFFIKGVAMSSGLAQETLLFEALHVAPYPHDIVAFTVFKVDITGPSDNDVFLHGDKATFTAEITPNVAVDTWEWEIVEGEGSPSSGNTDTYEPVVKNEDEDYDNPDIFKVIITATVGGVESTDELQIKVVYPKIDVIDFKSTKRIIHEGDWAEHDPEWTSTITDKSVSVFTKKTKIKVDATFKTILPLTSPTEISRLYANAAWWVVGDCDLTSELTVPPVSGDSTVITMEGTSALVDMIYAYERTDWFWRELQYDWTYRMSETGSADHDIKPQAVDNKHDLYVTLAEPITDPSSPTVYETVLHISCTAARGETAVTNTISEVWTDGDFDDRDVRRKDGTLMKYYANSAAPYNTPMTLDELLKQANGRCGTWQELFLDTLWVQGIVSANPLNIDEKVDFVAAAQAAYNLKYGHPPEVDGYIANNTYANSTVPKILQQFPLNQEIFRFRTQCRV
jgi:hypothetical protein